MSMQCTSITMTCASMDTKYFRTELSQKRRFLLKMIDSIVDQTRENHLPVERELATVDSMNLKLQHSLSVSCWCTSRVHSGFISGVKIPQTTLGIRLVSNIQQHFYVIQIVIKITLWSYDQSDKAGIVNILIVMANITTNLCRLSELNRSDQRSLVMGRFDAYIFCFAQGTDCQKSTDRDISLDLRHKLKRKRIRYCARVLHIHYVAYSFGVSMTQTHLVVVESVIHRVHLVLPYVIASCCC